MRARICSHRGPGQFLPVEWSEFRADDMPTGVSRVVPEVARIPNHDVLVLDQLTVAKPVDVGPRSRRVSGEALTIVELVAAKAQHPEIPNAVRVRSPIARARNEFVAFAARRVAYAPFAVSGSNRRAAPFIQVPKYRLGDTLPWERFRPASRAPMP